MTSDRDQLIREKAYTLWEERGRPEGTGDADWEEAERFVREAEAGNGRDGVPADPPPAASTGAPASPGGMPKGATKPPPRKKKP